MDKLKYSEILHLTDKELIEKGEQIKEGFKKVHEEFTKKKQSGEVTKEDVEKTFVWWSLLEYHVIALANSYFGLKEERNEIYELIKERRPDLCKMVELSKEIRRDK